MSNNVDQRIVEMQFNNREFEKNINGSMKSLEKLDEQLKFKDSEKGFKKIEKAAKDTDLSPIEKSITVVQHKFSALEAVAFSALNNITNKVINSAEKWVKSLSIDQITEGWGKYEEKTNSVQTIMNATGKSIDEVNGQLKKLNWFTDETSYNFVDMTNNIGKFTSAGVDLKTAVQAIEGVATSAALAGANAQEASRAMYNFSQAMGAGSVKSIDWMSIENANMATKEFKEIIIDTAKSIGTLDKMGNVVGKKGEKLEVNFKNFKTTLSEGWFTSDVLVKSLEKYGSFADKLEAAMQATGENTTSALLRQVEKYKKGTLDVEKYAQELKISSSKLNDIMKDLGSETNDLGFRAFVAAQQAKTFTDAVNATKDAVSSGWMNTFEIIFGNYEEARKLWTNVAEQLWDVFASGAEDRNDTLSEIFDSPWDTLTKQVQAAGVETEDFKKALEDTAKAEGILTDEMIKNAGSFEESLKSGWLSGDIISKTLDKLSGNVKSVSSTAEDAEKRLKDFQSIVDQVVRGNFGNGQKRIEALTAAGWDYAKVQELVNKKIKGGAITLNDLSKEELVSIGLTEEEAEKLKELSAQAKESGTDISELIKNISKPSGRELLSDILTDSLSLLKTSIDAVKTAWSNIFTTDSGKIYDAISSVRNFIKNLVSDEEKLKETSDKITRTFQGLFSIIKIGLDLISIPFKIVFGAIKQSTDEVDVSILDITANVGDAITEFSKWISENETLKTVISGLTKVLSTIIKVVVKIVTKLKDLWEEFKNLPIVQELIEKIKTAASDMWEKIKTGAKDAEPYINKIKSAFDGLTLDNLGEKLSSALSSVKGSVTDFVSNNFDLSTIFGKITNFDKNSKKMTESIKTSFANMATGTAESVLKMDGSFGNLSASFTDFIGGVKNKLKNINFAPIALIGLGFGEIKVIEGLSKVIKSISDPINNLINGISSIGSAIYSLAKAEELKAKAEMVKAIAISVGILAASAFLLTKADSDDLTTAAVIIGVLLGALIYLTKTMDKINVQDIVKASSSILMFTGAIFVLVASLSLLSKIEFNQKWDSILKMIAVIGALGVVAVGLVFISKFAGSLEQAWTSIALMVSVAISLKIVVSALTDLVNNIGYADLGLIGTFLLEYLAVVSIILVVASKIDSSGKAFATILASAIALWIFSKTVSSFTDQGLQKMTYVLGLLSVFAIVISLVSKIGKTAKSANTAFLGIAAVLIGVSVAMKILESTEMGPDTIVKIGVLASIMIALGVAIRIMGEAGKNGDKAALSILAMAGALVIAAGAIWILSDLTLEEISKAGITVGALIVLFGVMMKLSKDVTSNMGTIIACIVALGVMVAAIYMLKDIPYGQLAASVGAIVLLLGSLSLVMFTLSKMEKPSLTAFVSLAAVSAIAVGIGFLLKYLTDEIADADKAIKIAVSLSVFVVAMSYACTELGLVGAFGKSAFTGILVLLTLIVALGALMVGIGALVTEFPQVEKFLDTALPILGKIGQGLGEFLGGIITGIGQGIANAFTAIMGSISEGMDKLRETASKFDEQTLTNFGYMMEALLMFAGASFVSSIATLGGISVIGLVAFGKTLGEFGGYFAKYLDAMAPYDVNLVQKEAQVLSNIGSFAESISDAQKFFGGYSFMSEFGASLEDFGPKLSSFIATLSKNDITSEEIAKARNMAQIIKIIAEATESIPGQGGWVQGIFGEQDLGKFGSQLRTFAGAFHDVMTDEAYADAFTADGAKTAGYAAEIIKKIAGAAKDIPEDGGWADAIFGTSSMEVFGAQFLAFTSSWSDFIQNYAAAFTDDGVKFAEKVAGVITTLANSADNIDNTGGLWGFIAGKQDMEDFGKHLKAFGTSYKEFTKELKEIPDEDFAAGDKVIAIFRTLVTTASLLNGTENSDPIKLSAITDFIKELGNSVSEFYKESSKIVVDENANEKLTRFSADFSTLKTTFNSFSGIYSSGSDPDDFIDYIEDVSDAIKEFYDNLSEITTSDRVSPKILDFKASVESINDIDFSGSNDLITKLKEFTTGAIDKIKEFFGDDENTNEGHDIGKNLASGISSGIDDGKKDVETSSSKIAESGIDSVNETIDDPNNGILISGKNFVQGFANGINNNKYISDNAAKNLGKNAVSKLNEGIDSASPSKETIKSGSYFSEGFSIGIQNGNKNVVESATIVGKGAIDAINTAIDAHSPSWEAVLSGLNVDLGLSKGLDSGFSDVAKTALGVGKNVIDKLNIGLNIDDVGDTASEIAKNFDLSFAESLEKEKNAENSAEKKAQTIANAFSKALETYTAKSSLITGTLELWKSKNPNASEIEATEKEIDSAISNRSNLLATVTLKQAQVETLIKNGFSKTSKEVMNAQKELLDAQKNYYDNENNIVNKQQELISIQNEQAESIRNNKNEIIQNELELYKTRNQHANSENIANAELNSYRSQSKNLYDQMVTDQKEYAKLNEELANATGDTSELLIKVQEAQIKAQNSAKEYWDNEASINTLIEEKYERMQERYERIGKIADKEWELEQNSWDETISEQEKLERTKIYQLEKAKRLAKERAVAQKEYDEAVQKYGKDSDYAQELYIDYLEKRGDHEEAISDLQKTVTQLSKGTNDIDQVQASRDFFSFLQENMQMLKDNGMSETDIIKAAATQSAYSDWDKYLVRTLMNKYSDFDDINDTVRYALRDANLGEYGPRVMREVLMELGYSREMAGKIAGYSSEADEMIENPNKAVTNAYNELNKEDVKNAVAEGTRNGIEASSSSETASSTNYKSLSDAITETAAVTEEDKTKFIQNGEEFIINIAKGIQNKKEELIMQVKSIAEEACNAALDVIKSKAESMSIMPVVSSGIASVRHLQLESASKIAETISSNGSANRGGGAAESNYTYIQNIYSPESVSAIDVYRGTANQLAYKIV